MFQFTNKCDQVVSFCSNYTCALAFSLTSTWVVMRMCLMEILLVFWFVGLSSSFKLYFLNIKLHLEALSLELPPWVLNMNYFWRLMSPWQLCVCGHVPKWGWLALHIHNSWITSSQVLRRFIVSTGQRMKGRINSKQLLSYNWVVTPLTLVNKHTYCSAEWMSNEEQLLLTCFLYNEVYYSWEVIFGHFIKTVKWNNIWMYTALVLKLRHLLDSFSHRSSVPPTYSVCVSLRT